MIDFEEELKKFEPSMEVEDAEDAIYNRDLTDMCWDSPVYVRSIRMSMIV